MSGPTGRERAEYRQQAAGRPQGSALSPRECFAVSSAVLFLDRGRLIFLARSFLDDRFTVDHGIAVPVFRDVAIRMRFPIPRESLAADHHRFAAARTFHVRARS